MKIFYPLIMTMALGAATWSCQGEAVGPKAENGPAAQGSIEGLQRPDNPCGTSTFTNFVDVSNTPMGSIEVLNSEGQLFILVDMNPGWLLQGVKVFAGNSVDVPKTGAGLMQVEEFPNQFIHTRAQDKSTFRIDLSALPSCYAVALQGQAVQLNMFGNVTNSRIVWASGTTVLNGKMFNYCNGVCSGMMGTGPADSN